MKRFMIALLLAPVSALACNPVQVQNVTAMLHRGEAAGLGAFAQDASCYYWPAYYDAAQLMFREGRKDMALQWLYAGEIRARVAAGLDPDASRNNAMMVALNQGIATPIKAYARTDKENWLRQIDAALAWDEAHPLRPEPMRVVGAADVAIELDNFQKVYALVRDGLRQMRADIASKSESELGQTPEKIDLTR